MDMVGSAWDVADIGLLGPVTRAVNIRPVEGPRLALSMAVLGDMLCLVRTQDLQLRYQRQQRPRGIIRGKVSEAEPEMAK